MLYGVWCSRKLQSGKTLYSLRLDIYFKVLKFEEPPESGHSGGRKGATLAILTGARLRNGTRIIELSGS